MEKLQQIVYTDPNFKMGYYKNLLH